MLSSDQNYYTVLNVYSSRQPKFQTNKSLRRILDIPSTYIDRSYTNERLYSLIREQYGCHYESFGESWRKRKCKLLGHILRCHHSDPLHQVTFSYDNVSSRTPPLLRPGRPRADWLCETYKDACQYLYGPLRVFDISDRQLLTDIKQAARDRTGPFVTQ